MNDARTKPLHPQGRPWVRLLTTLLLGMTGLLAHAAPARYQPVVEKQEPRTHECDVAVYGGTPAGVTAARSFARLRITQVP